MCESPPRVQRLILGNLVSKTSISKLHCLLFPCLLGLSHMKVAGIPRVKQRSSHVGQDLQHKIKTNTSKRVTKSLNYTQLVYIHTSQETGRQYQPFQAPRDLKVGQDFHHSHIFGCKQILRLVCLFLQEAKWRNASQFDE